MDPWADWIRAACLPSNCNCEAVRQAWIAQPSAFWSSGAYFLALMASWISVRQKTVAFGIWILAFGILGLASHFAHGSMTEVAMACDFAGICLLLLTPGFTRIARTRASPRFHFAATPLLFLILVWAFYGSGKLIKIGIALGTFLISMMEHRFSEPERIREPGFRKSLGILVASFMLFLWDESKIQCEPTHWIQGHTLWHLGSAWAIYEYTRWRFLPPSAPEV
jgi:hypothetical protein